jgi:hypothetical protein
VIHEAVAAELDVLASRVRRMSPPLASNPNRFHEERSEIAHDLADLARRIAPRTKGDFSHKVEVSDSRRGRIIVATQTINGRRVMVQKRRAFAVFVGERLVATSRPRFTSVSWQYLPRQFSYERLFKVRTCTVVQARRVGTFLAIKQLPVLSSGRFVARNLVKKSPPNWGAMVYGKQTENLGARQWCSEWRNEVSFCSIRSISKRLCRTITVRAIARILDLSWVRAEADCLRSAAKFTQSLFFPGNREIFKKNREAI